MNVLQRGAVAFGFVLVGLGFASCSGGGPNVPALYPTASASGTTATPTPTSTSSAGATSTPTGSATSTPTGSATATPSGAATSTPVATATPIGLPTSTPGATATPAATATPVATATPTTAATATPAANCPPAMPYPQPAQTTIAFSTNTGTINLPQYQDATGTSDIPMITDGLPASVTIKLSRTNFDNLQFTVTGTPVLYASLILQGSNSAQKVTFTTNSIPVHLTSPCSVLAGHTYNLYGFAGGAQIEMKSNLMPSGDTVSTTLDIPALYGNSFPYNTLVDIEATQN